MRLEVYGIGEDPTLKPDEPLWGDVPQSWPADVVGEQTSSVDIARLGEFRRIDSQPITPFIVGRIAANGQIVE
jgi:hypothetical protein